MYDCGRSMKIAILAFGTRGDVQPYIALGKGLQARGHDVLLGAPDNFESWVKSHDLPFRSLGIDIQAFLAEPEVRAVLGGNIFALAKLWREKGKPMVRATLEATWEAARDVDLIVYHPKVAGATDVAEATGAGLVCASPIPLFATREFPIVVVPMNLGGFLNRLTYKGFHMSRAAYVQMLDDWRAKSLGLGKGPKFAALGGFMGGLVPRLCAVSPAVVPRPGDWDPDAHMTGYWFLDEGRDWRPSPELQAFLDAGEPPVYVGFGSMAGKNPERTAQEVVEGVRLAGVRAILATGWGGLNEIAASDRIHVIDGAPHDVLFRHVSAVVHHGGAGSTAAGLRAGRPTLVCPLTVDQPFWASQVFKMGCGPKPQSLRRLRADRFARGLEDLVGNTSYRERAEAIARAIAAEDGVANAIEVIEALRPARSDRVDAA